MNLNKFTEKAQEAVLAAQNLATELNHAEVEPEHLLVALVEQPGGIVPSMLRKLNARPGARRSATRATLLDRPCRRPTARDAAAVAAAEAGLRRRRRPKRKRLQDEYVSTEHLLLALATEAGRSPGRAAAAAQRRRPRTRSTRR